MKVLNPSKWEQRFIELAAHVAQWSQDPSTKVGAVIVNDLKQVIGMGFNGFPRGMRDDAYLYANRPVKYKRVVHAEPNAITNAVSSVRGETMIVTMFPCHECAKHIIQAGIKRIITPKCAVDRWDESHKLSQTFFDEARVTVDTFKVPFELRAKYPMTFK